MARKVTLALLIATFVLTQCQCGKKDPARLAALDNAMMEAVTGGDVGKVKELLDQGARVEVTDLMGMTLLHIAVFQGRKEIAELLIAKGARVNGEDKEGNRPLHMASEQGRSEVAELLIGKGADVNAKNRAGATPLDRAVSVKRQEVADLLRKHGAKTGKELDREKAK